jgi:hypothetical protein
VKLKEFKEARDEDGHLIRAGVTTAAQSSDGRDVCLTPHYEKIDSSGTVERFERDWHRRGWIEAQITELLQQAGFSIWDILPRNEPPPRPVFAVIAIA